LVPVVAVPPAAVVSAAGAVAAPVLPVGAVAGAVVVVGVAAVSPHAVSRMVNTINRLRNDTIRLAIRLLLCEQSAASSMH
jgi:hypothetical protein